MPFSTPRAKASPPLRQNGAPTRDRSAATRAAACSGARCLLVAAAFTLGLGFGCAGPRGAAQRDPANTLVIGTPESFENVNELIVQGSSFNDSIVKRLFLSLFDELPNYDKKPADYEPRLAESWSFTEDGLALEVKLRKGVTWSDGEPVTANDVRFTWLAQTSPEVGWLFSDIKQDIQDVEVVNEQVVRFHFSRASVHSLIDANEGVILPRHVWERLPFAEWRSQPHWFQENVVSSGPYLLESWQRGERLLLRRNDRYYEPGLPHIENVAFLTIAEPAALVQRLRSGDIDYAYSLRPADVQSFVGDAGFEVLTFAQHQFNLVIWNTRREFFADARVRRALTLAINRQRIIDTLWHGFATPASGPIVSWVWAHDRSISPLPYDPSEAASLLDAAGWLATNSDGMRQKDGRVFAFDLTTNPGSETRWDALQMIGEQLRAIGIAARPQLVEYDKLYAMNLAHDFDGTLTAFNMDTTLDVSYLLHSRDIDDGYNFGAFSDPALDRLIDEVRAQTEPENMRLPIHEIERIVQDEQPMTFLWETLGTAVSSRRLADVEANLVSPIFALRRWRLR